VALLRGHSARCASPRRGSLREAEAAPEAEAEPEPEVEAAAAPDAEESKVIAVAETMMTLVAVCEGEMGFCTRCMLNVVRPKSTRGRFCSGAKEHQTVVPAQRVRTFLHAICMGACLKQ
jgi:hypothetical protein